MFRLKINKDDNIAEPYNEDTASKVASFLKGNHEPYVDWLLLKDAPQYRIYGVVDCHYNYKGSDGFTRFSDNKVAIAKLYTYLEIPRLDNNTMLVLISETDATKLSSEDQGLYDVLKTNKKVNQAQVDKLLSGKHSNEKAPDPSTLELLGFDIDNFVRDAFKAYNFTNR